MGRKRWSKSRETSDFSALSREFDPDCKHVNTHSSYIVQAPYSEHQQIHKLVGCFQFSDCSWKYSSHEGYSQQHPYTYSSVGLGLGLPNAAMPHPPLRSIDAEVSPLSEPEILLQELWGIDGTHYRRKTTFFARVDIIVDADFFGTLLFWKLRQVHESFWF